MSALSGSMGSCWDNTISSFNEYLTGLKKDKKYGKVLFTFTKFEGRNVNIVHDAVKIGDAKDINRLKFLARLSGEIGKRGVIDVLRNGVDHGPLHFDLFFGTPSPDNANSFLKEP